MIVYEECLSRHHLEPLKMLVYINKFSSVTRALGYAISDLIMDHVNFGHIGIYEPHNAKTLIKKGFYKNEEEFVRVAAREFLKKRNLWLKNFD